MTHILAAIIWGVVNSTMVCKTSGNPFASIMDKNYGPRS